ncbi:MAG: hypothetical protein CL424_11045 [Acidimicrobiaceae bacterium]|nr:hypothetical protein [Acidimicrobiaceae bacterium]
MSIQLMSPQLLTVVVIAANVLGGAMAIPQARKLLRSRRVEGVSPTWAAVSAAVNAAWIPYGFATGDVGIVPVSVVSVLAYLSIAAGICRYGHLPVGAAVARMLTSAAAVLVVPAVVLVVEGWVAAGVTLGVFYGVQLTPAVVTVYRTVDVSGVSLATWVIAFVEAALWGIYGLGRGDAGLLSLAASGMFMATLVLVRLAARRPRRDRTYDGSVEGAYDGLGLSPA